MTVTATVVRETETPQPTVTETPIPTITATITQSPLQAEQFQILNEAAPGAWEWEYNKQDVCAFSDLMMTAIRCDTCRSAIG